jgi:hypothetical protein
MALSAVIASHFGLFGGHPFGQRFADRATNRQNALSFVSPNFQLRRGASGDGGVSLNSRESQSTIRP